MHCETLTPWIQHPEELGQELQKQKISSLEEQDTSNVPEEVEKEDTQEDPSKKTDKGKSSHAFLWETRTFRTRLPTEMIRQPEPSTK
jgi:hypothetical protein